MSFSSPLVRLLPRSPLAPSTPAARPPSPPAREICSISQIATSNVSMSSPTLNTPRGHSTIGESTSGEGKGGAGSSSPALQVNTSSRTEKKGKKEKGKDKKEKEKKEKKDKSGKNIAFYKKKSDSATEQEIDFGGSAPTLSSLTSTPSSPFPPPISGSAPSLLTPSPEKKYSPGDVEEIVSHVVSLYANPTKERLVPAFLCSFEQFQINKVSFFDGLLAIKKENIGIEETIEGANFVFCAWMELSGRKYMEVDEKFMRHILENVSDDLAFQKIMGQLIKSKGPSSPKILSSSLSIPAAPSYRSPPPMRFSSPSTYAQTPRAASPPPTSTPPSLFSHNFMPRSVSPNSSCECFQDSCTICTPPPSFNSSTPPSALSPVLPAAAPVTSPSLSPPTKKCFCFQATCAICSSAPSPLDFLSSISTAHSSPPLSPSPTPSLSPTPSPSSSLAPSPVTFHRTSSCAESTRETSPFIPSPTPPSPTSPALACSSSFSSSFSSSSSSSATSFTSSSSSSYLKAADLFSLLSTSLFELGEVREIADRVTYLMWKSYRHITPSELFDGYWQGKNREKEAPNIHKLGVIFNHLSSLCSVAILNTQEEEPRLQILIQVIELGTRLKKMRNFEGMGAVGGVFGSASIQRLKDLWASLPKKALAKKKEIDRLLNPANNYEELEKHVSAARAEGHACIPLIAPRLRCLRYLYDSQSKMEDGLVNFPFLMKTGDFIYKLLPSKETEYKIQSPEQLGDPLHNALDSNLIIDTEKMEDALYERSVRLFSKFNSTPPSTPSFISHATVSISPPTSPIHDSSQTPPQTPSPRQPRKGSMVSRLPLSPTSSPLHSFSSAEFDKSQMDKLHEQAQEQPRRKRISSLLSGQVAKKST